MGIIIALLILCLIVTFHEFGHFIVAKLCNIRVDEFAVGMGPKLLQKQIGETKYSLRLLPLGGYNSFGEEGPEDKDPRGFYNAPLWKRMLVTVAGAVMNFILGFIMLIIMVSMFYSIVTTQISEFGREIAEDGTVSYYSQSYKTGLRENDIILKIDGTPIYSIMDVNFILMSAENQTHNVTVRRDGEKMKLENVTFLNEKTGDVFDFNFAVKDKTPAAVIECSGRFFMSMSQVVVLSLKQLVTGKVDKEEVTGPVGIVQAVGETAEEAEDVGDAIYGLSYMTALITINLGIANLLPIPFLDGGNILLGVIEAIRRKRIKPEHEGYIKLAGLAVLLTIMVFATFNDISRIFNK